MRISYFALLLDRRGLCAMLYTGCATAATFWICHLPSLSSCSASFASGEAALRSLVKLSLVRPTPFSGNTGLSMSATSSLDVSNAEPPVSDARLFIASSVTACSDFTTDASPLLFFCTKSTRWVLPVVCPRFWLAMLSAKVESVHYALLLSSFFWLLVRISRRCPSVNGLEWRRVSETYRMEPYATSSSVPRFLPGGVNFAPPKVWGAFLNHRNF